MRKKRIIGITLTILGGFLLIFIFGALALVMIGILPANPELQIIIDRPSYLMGQLFVYSLPLIIGLSLVRKSS